MSNNTEKKRKSSSIRIINPIEAAPIPNEKTWVSVLKTFNPLGPLAESYAKTLAYKIECKRLDAEVRRIEEQSFVLRESTEKVYKLRMEELLQRRTALERFYDTVQNQLENLHIERMKVLEMAELVTKKALDPSISLEERKLYKEMASEITAQIPNFGDRANQSLQTIVEALPPVSIPDRLTPNDD
jgi:hypothetical protein